MKSGHTLHAWLMCIYRENASYPDDERALVPKRKFKEVKKQSLREDYLLPFPFNLAIKMINNSKVRDSIKLVLTFLQFNEIINLYGVPFLYALQDASKRPVHCQ